MFQTPSILKYKIKKSDLIIVDFPYLYPLAKHTKKPFYLNTHNAEFEIYNNFSLISSLVKKIELAGFDKAKKVFFCNTNDQRKYIKQLPDLLAKSFILPNGIDIFDFKHNDEFRQKTRKLMKISDITKVFLFTGSQYLPNKEALEFLIRWCEANQEEILKLNILVLVVGSVSEDLIDKNYIKVIGKVQNIVPYFSASDYGINPIITGSGTNVKMSEFMAAELPILTTVFGSRGFTLVDNQSCWFFERDQLLKTMKNVILQNSIHCKSITSNAFIQNIEKIDMFRALNSLHIQW
jgi:glycosyltransferase involved in cell wall biosynthesis